MSIKWLSNHWFLLAFVFASGGAAAWQEVNRQELKTQQKSLESLVQAQQVDREAIIRLDTGQIVIKQDIRDLRSDIKEILRLQREAVRRD